VKALVGSIPTASAILKCNGQGLGSTGMETVGRRCDFTYPFATSGNNRGWKPPYQSAADAIDQAHRLADGYNRQFLRVLRQMRDLRRYAPPVIVNNGGQVNVASQQVNVAQTT
jgi:hypothetical protein